MDKTRLGNRMKSYENTTRGKLLAKTPVLIRVDGKSFSKLTSSLVKPHDHKLSQVMQYTAMGMCENIQGSKLAYVQSDEISILCTDFETYETQQWFVGDLRKIISVSAALASTLFNHWFNELLEYNPMALFEGMEYACS